MIVRKQKFARIATAPAESKESMSGRSTGKRGCRPCRGTGKVPCDECDSKGMILGHVSMSTIGPYLCDVCQGTKERDCFCTTLTQEQWEKLFGSE